MRMYDDQTILRPYTHFIFVLVPPQLPSRSTLFPYTTLFRSYGGPFGRRIAMLAMSGTNSVHSLICPAVTRKPMTTPFRSQTRDRKSTRLNSSHLVISYAVFCLKKKKKDNTNMRTITESDMWS